MANLYNWPARRVTTLEDVEQDIDARVIRHPRRRAEDRESMAAIQAGLQMVRDPGPDTVPVPRPAGCNGNCNQGRACDCPDGVSTAPRVPRLRYGLTTAGWAWLTYLIGFAAIAAWAYSAWQ